MFMWSVGRLERAAGLSDGALRSSADTFSASTDLIGNSAGDGYQLRLVMDQAGDATAFGFAFSGFGPTARTEIVAARYTAATGRLGPFTTLMSPVPTGADGVSVHPGGRR